MGYLQHGAPFLKLVIILFFLLVNKNFIYVE